jgi:hypothetical protein
MVCNKCGLIGKGFFEDEYNRRANLIPNVNQKLLAEIGTDLKYRLEKSLPTTGIRNILSQFNIKTRKEVLVDEAIAKLTSLNNKVNNLPKGEPPLTPLYPTVTEPIRKKYARYLYNKDGKVTGTYGKEVVREHAPKYDPITGLNAPYNYFKHHETIDYNPDEVPVADRPIYHTIKDPEGFKTIYINSFDFTTPIPWGKFNAVFVKVRIGNEGHVAVLIRNLTDPISYAFYDSHGRGWRHPTSDYYRFREKLDKIVGNAQVSFNDSQHQCFAPLCQSFTKIRITYPDLTNEQYNQKLIETAKRIVNDPKMKFSSVIGIPGLNRNLEQIPLNINNNRAVMKNFLDKNVPRQTNVEGYELKGADVIYAPLIANKVLNNLTRNVPSSTGMGNKLKLVSVAKSTRKGKKWMATFTNGTKTHFGSAGMDDYTLTKDSKQKELYRNRHQKDLKSNDPTRAGFLSYYLLWNKPTLEASIKDFKKLFSV